MNSSRLSADEAYNELCCYTMTLGDGSFIHQHVVDAYCAQTYTVEDKPIGFVFALVGLYLHVEMGFTGKQVQLAHMKLAKRKQEWPRLAIPKQRGDTTAIEVIASGVGPDRDRMIHIWCESVWKANSENAEAVQNLLEQNSII